VLQRILECDAVLVWKCSPCLKVEVPKFWLTKLCKVAPNILIQFLQFFLYTHKNLYQLTCIGQKAPDNSKFHGLLQNFGSSEWTLLFVIFLASRLWENLWVPVLKNHSAFIFRVKQSLEVKALWSLETMGTAQQTTQHQIPEKLNQRYHNYVFSLLAEF